MGIGKNDFSEKLSQFLEICKMQFFVDEIGRKGCCQILSTHMTLKQNY